MKNNVEHACIELQSSTPQKSDVFEETREKSSKGTTHPCFDNKCFLQSLARLNALLHVSHHLQSKKHLECESSKYHTMPLVTFSNHGRKHKLWFAIKKARLRRRHESEGISEVSLKKDAEHWFLHKLRTSTHKSGLRGSEFSCGPTSIIDFWERGTPKALANYRVRVLEHFDVAQEQLLC